MTRVFVVVVEDQPVREGVTTEQEILRIDVATYTQGVQFGEISAAVTFAQKVVKAASKVKP